MSETTYKILFCFIALFILGLAGQMDCQEEESKILEYCEMTKEGHWPKFDESIDCEGIE